MSKKHLDRTYEEFERKYMSIEKLMADKKFEEVKNMLFDNSRYGLLDLLDSKTETTRSEILAKAEECVCGHREQDYGTPEDNFNTIADLWSVYLRTEVTAKDVTMMMALLKIARIQSGNGTLDCFVDLAGYAACGGEISTK